MGKLIEYTDQYGDNYTLAFERAEYCFGDIAIEVHCKEEGEEWWEPYATLTVNLGLCFDGQAHLDTNNVKHLCEFVMERGWAKRIGEGASGYCTYPLVEFTDEFLNDICLDAEKGDML